MARPPRPPIDITPEPANELIEQAAEAATELSTAHMAVLNTVELFKTVGRIEMAELVATVAERVIAEAFISVKQSKSYKGLPYKTADGKVATVATLDEFCEAYLKKSYRRCQELATNYHLLGPALYERAEQIGLHQRDYNALKALPAGDQDVVREAIETESREKVLDLMQELVVRHASKEQANAVEKATLEKQLADERATVAAARRRGEEAAAERDELKEKLYKRDFEPKDWGTEVSKLDLDITIATGRTLQQLDALEQFREHIGSLEMQTAPEAATRALAISLLDTLDQIQTEFDALIHRAYRDFESIRSLARMGEPDYLLSDLPTVGQAITDADA